jgi:chorismate mutase
VEQSNVEAKRQRQIFDIQNALARQQANAQMAQQSNIYNLQRQQEVMDRNIQQANQEALRRNYLAPQQMFQNQMAQAQARAGLYGQRAGLAQSQGQAQAQGIANMFGGIASAASGYAGMQQRGKELDLRAKHYGYKWDDEKDEWWKT